MTYILNGEKLRDRTSAHPYLARMLDLPDYYGNNLDALFDCLAGMGARTLVLLGADGLEAAGGYGAKVVRTLADAARDNPHLRLELVGKEPRL